MSHYRPYPAYKDSGVEWLGKVPTHWRISAVKWEFESRLGKMLQPKPNDPADFEVPYHKAISVQWERIAMEAPETMWASVSDVDTYQVRKGDLLICEGGDVGRAAIFKNDDSEPLITQNSLHRVRPRNGNLNEGLLRIMQVVRAAGWFDVLCSKATIVHFTGEKLGSLAYPVATVAEQRTIATHLDRETARIDALVSKKTRFIELLREKRQALITHAVTKGLDPNVKKKDSGVEWLGKVPEHWRVKPFKVCIDFQEGPGIMAADFHNEGIPLLRISGVQGRWATLEGCNYLDPIKVAKQWGHFRLSKGDLLISASASMGTCSEVGDETAGSIAYTGLIRLRGKANMMVKAYVRALVVSSVFATQIDLFKAGSTIQHFGPTHLSQMLVVCPPIEEQQAIADHIDRETTRIDTLICKTERSIELLKERRSALITAAITGQIDVREAA